MADKANDLCFLGGFVFLSRREGAEISLLLGQMLKHPLPHQILALSRKGIKCQLLGTWDTLSSFHSICSPGETTCEPAEKSP